MGSRLYVNSATVRRQIQDRPYYQESKYTNSRRLTAVDRFDNEQGEEYDASKFGNFGDYMRRKKIKLQNLDAEIRTSSDGFPPIFRGVVAHVNGFTQPSLQELHRLIVRYGGGFIQYLNGKTAATHIIASSLTPKKREELRRYRVVRPAWVVESIKAERLLPWGDFKVVQGSESQRILKLDNGLVLSRKDIEKQGYKNQTRIDWDSSQLKIPYASYQAQESPVEYPADFKVVSSIDADALKHQSGYGKSPPSNNMSNAEVAASADREDSAPNFQALAEEVIPSNPGDCGGSRTAEDQVSPVRDPLIPKPEMTPEEHNAQLLQDPRVRSCSGANPEFIQQYYRESRLHHLSTWKAELKAQLQSLAKDKPQYQTRRKKFAAGSRRYILHVDFDCFFAAVSTLKHPEYSDDPVAVAHGSGAGSEIASCNYAARAQGVRNGMWMKSALQCCPGLKVLPYDFSAYEDASRKFYGAILALDCVVQSVSIDEALVDITARCLEAGGTDGRGISEGSIYREQMKADEIGGALRDLVKEKIGCAVSVGIGGNILLARIALRKAKPAGQFQLKPDAVLDFIGNLPVQDLPGVGHSLEAKMEELGIKLVKDIRDTPKEKLLSALGPKIGAKIWDYARGIDRTEVGNEIPRKSVSAEVNWGIRFANQLQAEDFVRSLSEELHRRLVENLVKGKQLTLKILRRSADAPLEPVKHLGHGKCDVFNKSVAFNVASNDTVVLAREALSMLRDLGIPAGDLRGVGIQMTKLEPFKPGATGRFGSSQQQLSFRTSPVRERPTKPVDPDDLDSPRKEDIGSVNHGPLLDDRNQKPLNITGTQFIMPSQPDPEVLSELPSDIKSRLLLQKARRYRPKSPSPPSGKQHSMPELPPQSQLDPDVLTALPEDVRSEILSYYKTPLSGAEPSPPIPPGRQPLTGPVKPSKKIIPMKRRRNRPAAEASGNMKITQPSFGLFRPSLANCDSQTPPPVEAAVSEDFLAALPEDIRQEVLESHRRSTRQRVITPLARIEPQPEKSLHLPPPPERPTFTSKRLSDLSDLRGAVGAWYTAFEGDGPFRGDVDSLSQYLKRVILDEKDVDKAVSVVSWLSWLVIDGKHNNKSPPKQSQITEKDSQDGIIFWDEALQVLCEDIDGYLQERGLPPVKFD